MALQPGYMGLLHGYRGAAASSVWDYTDVGRVEQRIVLNDVGVGHVAVGELGHLTDVLAQVLFVGTESVALVRGHTHGASGVYDQYDAVWVVVSDGMVRRERLGLQHGHRRRCVGRVKGRSVKGRSVKGRSWFLAVDAGEPPRLRVCILAPVWHHPRTDVQCTGE